MKCVTQNCDVCDLYETASYDYIWFVSFDQVYFFLKVFDNSKRTYDHDNTYKILLNFGIYK